MLEWNADGRAQWFDASGVGEQRGGMTRPTRGRVTSNFGMRRHPILGYKRMHSGMDFGGGYGAPIHAVTDGVVTIAGRHGGFGTYVKPNHGNGPVTGRSEERRVGTEVSGRVTPGGRPFTKKTTTSHEKKKE